MGEFELVFVHMAYILCPAYQALDNASLHSGVVVGLKVEVVVCVCLLDNGCEGVAALSLHWDVQ